MSLETEIMHRYCRKITVRLWNSCFNRERRGERESAGIVARIATGILERRRNVAHCAPAIQGAGGLAFDASPAKSKDPLFASSTAQPRRALRNIKNKRSFD